ncbi:MAG: phosphatase PAP2 family protein [Bacteroidota bacterium]
MQKLEFLDTQLFLFLNSFHNDLWDTVMYFMSDKYFWAPLYALLLVLISIKLGWKRLLLILPLIALLILLSDQGSVLLKNIFQRYRPCHNLIIADLVHTINGKCGGQFGFVSSHAANTFALAVFVGMLLRKRLKWMFAFMLLWASLVSYSRIYTGVHYPADVLGGALVGGVLGFLLVKGYFYGEKRLCSMIV